MPKVAKDFLADRVEEDVVGDGQPYDGGLPGVWESGLDECDGVPVF